VASGTAVAYLADIMAPEHRAASAGLLLAMMSLSIMATPMVGAVAGAYQKELFAICLGASAAVLPLCYWTLPESLRDEDRRPATFLNPFVTLKMLNRSRLFRRLTACAMASGIALQGTQTILFFYLKQRFELTATDLSHVILGYGVSSFVVQGVCLKPLRDWLGERLLLIFGMVMCTLNQLCMGLLPPAWGKTWVLIMAVAIGPWSYLTIPAIAAIKSINVDETEQGAIQGALFGAQSLASGVAPLFLGVLYNWFTKRHESYIIMFLVAGIAFIGVLFAISIPTTNDPPRIRPLEEGWMEYEHVVDDDTTASKPSSQAAQVTGHC